MQTKHTAVIRKLIALWAFAEAGFGGLLHLLHLPLTGLLVGGFAVIINVLLARFGDCRPAVFMKALGLVLAVKFLVSPFSPLGAYIAVGFQGLLAMLVFYGFGLSGASILVVAVLAMMESATQKPVMAYLLMGKDFWSALLGLIDQTFHLSQKTLSDTVILSFGIYMLLHAIWGVVIAQWANRLRRSISSFESDLIVPGKLRDFVPAGQDGPPAKTKNRISAKQLAVAAVLPVLFWLVLTNTLSFFSLARILLMSLLFFYVLPFLTRRHQRFLFRRHRKSTEGIIAEIPLVRERTLLAWELTRSGSGLQRLQSFVTYVIWLNVFYEPPAKNEIFILTGPVHSGKSRALMNWVKGRSVAGFLTPRLSGRKILFDVLTGEESEYEVASLKVDAIHVGNYILSRQAFVRAGLLLHQALQGPSDWIVIDEVGKLELRQAGHHGSLLEALQSGGKRILLVVRDTLLEEVMTHYGIRHAIVIHTEQLESMA